MKTRRERDMIMISESKYNEMRDDIQRHAMQDGYHQAIAEMLYILSTKEKDKWGKKRLEEFMQRIREMNEMPPVFGEYVTDGHVIDYLKSQYGIDVESLEIYVDLEVSK